MLPQQFGPLTYYPGFVGVIPVGNACPDESGGEPVLPALGGPATVALHEFERLELGAQPMDSCCMGEREERLHQQPPPEMSVSLVAVRPECAVSVDDAENIDDSSLVIEHVDAVPPIDVNHDLAADAIEHNDCSQEEACSLSGENVPLTSLNRQQVAGCTNLFDDKNGERVGATSTSVLCCDPTIPQVISNSRENADYDRQLLDVGSQAGDVGQDMYDLPKVANPAPQTELDIFQSLLDAQEEKFLKLLKEEMDELRLATASCMEHALTLTSQEVNRADGQFESAWQTIAAMQGDLQVLRERLEVVNEPQLSHESDPPLRRHDEAETQASSRISRCKPTCELHHMADDDGVEIDRIQEDLYEANFLFISSGMKDMQNCIAELELSWKQQIVALKEELGSLEMRSAKTREVETQFVSWSAKLSDVVCDIDILKKQSARFEDYESNQVPHIRQHLSGVLVDTEALRGECAKLREMASRIDAQSQHLEALNEHIARLRDEDAKLVALLVSSEKSWNAQYGTLHARVASLESEVSKPSTSKVPQDLTAVSEKANSAQSQRGDSVVEGVVAIENRAGLPRSDAPISSAGVVSSTDPQQDPPSIAFKQFVQTRFAEFRRDGMTPNEAAARAIKEANSSLKK